MLNQPRPLLDTGSERASAAQRYPALALSFGVIGFLISVTQVFGLSPDYENYEIFFNLLRSEGFDPLFSYRFEPGFTIVALCLTYIFQSNAVVYSIFVAGLTYMKALAANSLARSRLVLITVAAFYLIRYFPLFELTQLRAASSCTFVLIAMLLLRSNSRLSALAACAVAVSFHASAIAVIPALLVRASSRLVVVLLGVVLYFLVQSGSSLIVNTLPSYLIVFAEYEQIGLGDLRLNPFAPTTMLDWIFIALSLWFWDRLSSIMKQVALLEIFGMAIFYGASDFPVIAFRIREFYSVFWVFLVADGLGRNGLRIPVVGLVTSSIGLYAYLFFFRGTFFQ